jgi:hypothetical protein
MNQINELSGMLKQEFNWNKARIDCLIGMVVGLIKSRSINLTELAMMFPSEVKIESIYRRIQRFIHEFTLNFDQLAGFIMAMFGFLNTDYELVLDRTNWQWGKKTSIF